MTQTKSPVRPGGGGWVPKVADVSGCAPSILAAGRGTTDLVDLARRVCDGVLWQRYSILQYDDV